MNGAAVHWLSPAFVSYLNHLINQSLIDCPLTMMMMMMMVMMIIMRMYLGIEG